MSRNVIVCLKICQTHHDSRGSCKVKCPTFIKTFQLNSYKVWNLKSYILGRHSSNNFYFSRNKFHRSNISHWKVACWFFLMFPPWFSNPGNTRQYWAKLLHFKDLSEICFYVSSLQWVELHLIHKLHSYKYQVINKVWLVRPVLMGPGIPLPPSSCNSNLARPEILEMTTAM